MTEFDTTFSTTSFTQSNSNPFNVQSDKHLLSSLSSARGSIVALEVANKDLLDALSSRHTDLEKVQKECNEYQNKYNTQIEKCKQHDTGKYFFFYFYRFIYFFLYIIIIFLIEIALLKQELSVSNLDKSKILSDRDILQGKLQIAEQTKNANDLLLQDARNKVSSIEAEMINGMKFQIPSLQREIELLKALVSDRDNTISKKEKEVKDLRQKNDELDDLVASLKAQLLAVEQNRYISTVHPLLITYLLAAIFNYTINSFIL